MNSQPAATQFSPLLPGHRPRPRPHHRRLVIGLLMLILATSAPAQVSKTHRDKARQIHDQLMHKPTHLPASHVQGKCFTWNNIAFTLNSFEETAENSAMLEALIKGLPEPDEPLVSYYLIDSSFSRWTRTATDGPPIRARNSPFAHRSR
jgi:hypothetical protein